MREFMIAGSPCIWDCARGMVEAAERNRDRVWMMFNGLRLEAIYSRDPQQRTTVNQIVGKYREFLDAQAEQAKETTMCDTEEMTPPPRQRAEPEEPTVSKQSQDQRQLMIWQKYASYCRCCAQSGESDPDDFETFVLRLSEVPPEPEPQHPLLVFIDERIEVATKFPSWGHYSAGVANLLREIRIQCEPIIAELTAAQARISELDKRQSGLLADIVTRTSRIANLTQYLRECIPFLQDCKAEVFIKRVNDLLEKRS